MDKVLPYHTLNWAAFILGKRESRRLMGDVVSGRDASVDHQAVGAVRVMRTGGTEGKIIGMAASLCRKHDANPRACVSASPPPKAILPAFRKWNYMLRRPRPSNELTTHQSAIHK